MENSILIRPNDSVVTVIEPIAKGRAIHYPGCKQPLLASQDIPIYHKVAITEIKKGEHLYKYGEKFGIATTDIAPGEHVHIHNVASLRA